jgi:pyruvate carboxylase subunit B
MWHALKGTDYTLDINVKKILRANAVFKEAMKDYFFPPEALSVSSEVVLSPMPGGALTANTMMMRDTGTLHLYPQVIEAMAECVARGGFGTSVTPVSQFYFQQAYANVTQGAWKRITDGYGKMVLGYFGRTPVPPDEEIVKIAEDQLGKKRFDGDPVDVIEPGIPRAKKVLEDNNLPVTDENLFIVGALATPGGNKGLEFLQGKATIGVRKKSKEKKKVTASKPSSGTMSKEAYNVTVNGVPYAVEVEPATGNIVSAAPTEPKSSGSTAFEVKAELPGNVLNVQVKPGDVVRTGDTLVVLEAMKMETKVTSPRDGTVSEVFVSKGETVENGQTLVCLC